MTKRILKVNRLIKQELSQILLKTIDLPKNVLVTVTRVETSTNLIQSKVYISIMPEKQADKVLELLKNQIYFIQQKLNQRLNMRPVPKINFLKEKETAQAGKIEEILSELKKSGK